MGRALIVFTTVTLLVLSAHADLFDNACTTVLANKASIAADIGKFADATYETTKALCATHAIALPKDAYVKTIVDSKDFIVQNIGMYKDMETCLQTLKVTYGDAGTKANCEALLAGKKKD